MTTQTAQPLPVGPFTLTTDHHATESLQPTGAELALEALPLLAHRLRSRTIAPQYALRGSYLELRDGDEARLLRIDQDITRVGRGRGAHIGFEEHRVSRDHAILVRRGTEYYLDDCGSLNGTYVNRRRVESHRLTDGDELQIGKYKLAYFSR